MTDNDNYKEERPWGSFEVLYEEDQLKKIAELPSKEVLLAQTMSMINAPTTSIATGMNQIMSSLARGIMAVAEEGNK